METLEVIKKRASLKMRLSGREVEQEKIVRVLEAARLAPSARNVQPWHFIVVKGKEAVEALVDGAFKEVNQMVREAPVIIIACANPRHLPCVIIFLSLFSFSSHTGLLSIHNR